ncbi:MAG: hypothetical protein KDM91_13925 [Verrucomicrobiae bacterium]|nr:hypothetical protein [Verrucomicrobiae bacterium]MCP5540080.1 hypothetical protein [Akkermansiaceae bacterium]
MIRVSLDSLIVVYLTLLLGILFLVWVGVELVSSRRQRRRRRDFVICGICDHIYEDRTERKLLNCPRCGALNERSAVREI